MSPTLYAATLGVCCLLHGTLTAQEKQTDKPDGAADGALVEIRGAEDADRETLGPLDKLDALPMSTRIPLLRKASQHKLTIKEPGILTLAMLTPSGTPHVTIHTDRGLKIFPTQRKSIDALPEDLRVTPFPTSNNQSFALTMPIDRPGTYRITTSVTLAQSAEETPKEADKTRSFEPFAAAQWMPLPVAQKRKQFAKEIEKNAQALTLGTTTEFDLAKDPNAGWLKLKPEKDGLVMLTIKAKGADLAYGLYKPGQFDHALLDVDNNSGKPEDTESSIFPVKAGQTLLIHVNSFGAELKAFSARTVFVPDATE